MHTPKEILILVFEHTESGEEGVSSLWKRHLPPKILLTYYRCKSMPSHPAVWSQCGMGIAQDQIRRHYRGGWKQLNASPVRHYPPSRTIRRDDVCREHAALLGTSLTLPTNCLPSCPLRGETGGYRSHIRFIDMYVYACLYVYVCIYVHMCMYLYTDYPFCKHKSTSSKFFFCIQQL